MARYFVTKNIIRNIDTSDLLNPDRFLIKQSHIESNIHYSRLLTKFHLN